MELKPDRYIFQVMEDMIHEKDRRLLYLFVCPVCKEEADCTGLGGHLRGLESGEPNGPL